MDKWQIDDKEMKLTNKIHYHSKRA